MRRFAGLARLRGRGAYYLALGSLALFSFVQQHGLPMLLGVGLGFCQGAAGALCVVVGCTTTRELEALRTSLQERIAPEDARKVRAAFARFDTEATGTIEGAELRALCAELGVTLDEEGIAHALNDLDPDRTATVSLDGFLVWWADTQLALV